MSESLTPEEVAILIKARRIQKDKGLDRDFDVKSVCETAGVSRKTGYQWAEKFASSTETTARQEVEQELAELQAKYEKLSRDYDREAFENRARKLAWEIHHVDEWLASKKKHFQGQDKEKTVAFVRSESRSIRLISWLLGIALSTLSDWDQAYDDNLCPYRTSDKRGTTAKVSMEIIRHIVDKARALKERGNRLRITKFAQTIKDELQLDLGLKTIKDILIANDLWRPQTKKKRPEFYQSLCQQIPNGVLSLDGSTIDVHVGDLAISYNLELGVDAGSFCHTAHEITPTETGDAILSVLKKHQAAWGLPLGVVFDRGSSNLSEEVMGFLNKHDIVVLPAGPANPKGNGTDEGAFSQFKQALGEVHIDTSSPYALGKSVLDMLVCLYMHMRNKLPLRRPRPTPADQMQTPVSAQEQEKERARLIEHQQKKDDDAHQAKRDRLHWLINYHNITLSSAELQRAEYCIKGYDQEAITKSEEAFLRAVNRDHNRCNLSYFFGILRNIQQDLDDQRYQQYCQERYSYELHQENQRRKAEEQTQKVPTVDNILNLVVTAMSLDQEFLRQSAFTRCKNRIQEMISSIRYIGPLLKRFHEALGARTDLELEQKEQALTHIEQLIHETAAA